MLPLIIVFVLLLCSFLYSHPSSHKKLKSFILSITPKPAVDAVATASSIEIAQTKELPIIDKAELRRIFATFDANGDGFIAVHELKESLLRLGIETEDADLSSMIKKINSNSDGLLDIDEFSELYSSIGGAAIGDDSKNSLDEDNAMKDAFDVFDENGDGQITVEELEMVLRSLGLAAGNCKEMIKKVDADGDGKVNFDEFKRMMKNGKLF